MTATITPPERGMARPVALTTTTDRTSAGTVVTCTFAEPISEDEWWTVIVAKLYFGFNPCGYGIGRARVDGCTATYTCAGSCD